MWRVDQTKEEYKEYKEVSDNTVQNLNKDRERQLSYSQSLEKELEAAKGLTEALKELANDEIEKAKKELEAAKGKKLIGWVVQNEDDSYSMWILPTFTKEDGGWSVVGIKNFVDITPEQAAALCYRLYQQSFLS